MRLFCRFYNVTTKSGFGLSKGLQFRKCLLLNQNIIANKRTVLAIKFKRYVNTTIVHNEDEAFDEEYLLDSLETKDNLDLTRHMLFKENDLKIIELNKCVSVEQVLNFIKRYKDEYNDKYITQTILVLRDIQNVFQNINENTAFPNQFFIKLNETTEFKWLLKNISEILYDYNADYLSYTLFYLYKLGVPVEYDLIQKISLRLRNILVDDFSLHICSSLFHVIFSEDSIRPFYIANPIIPTVIDQIDKCKTLQNLEDITICLNKINQIISLEVLNCYKGLVSNFISTNRLSGKDYKILLKIILLLNYPQWRNSSAEQVSTLILLMKNEVNNFSTNELILLYKVFFKNQEPGEILNDIQRNSAKYLQQMEDIANKQGGIETKLQLFSLLMYFSSPNHRMQFKKDIQKYVNQCCSFGSLILLRKIYSYTRISEPDLCQLYWDKMLQILTIQNSKPYDIVDLCQNYIHFNTDIDNYRHYTFENKMLQMFEQQIADNTFSMYPKNFAMILSFSILYGKSTRLIEILIAKLKEMWKQIGAIDCLYISYSIYLLSEVKNKFITQNDVNKIKQILNQCTEHLMSLTPEEYKENNLLIKASIFRNDIDQPYMEELLIKYKHLDMMSSKILENICHSFSCTRTLVPEVINMCTEYVVKNKTHMLGFNAEKLLTLCYELAYIPINDDIFFEIIIDVILRDQERLSGLSFLQSALALSFFNKLPKSVIKMVFNTEFLEKLDVELANCYSKDRYIKKVRSRLMQLNRAVCLEYPECEVPWFHKKYLEEIQKKRNSLLSEPDNFILKVKNYLEGIVGNKRCVLENVIAPYGYHIDFVISLNSNNKIVEPDHTDVCTRLAILLCRSSAYTKLYTHLKGKYQMKKRHLEILGYKVVIVKYDEWVNLLYAQERIDFVKNIIWSEQIIR